MYGCPHRSPRPGQGRSLYPRGSDQPTDLATPDGDAGRDGVERTGSRSPTGGAFGVLWGEMKLAERRIPDRPGLAAARRRHDLGRRRREPAPGPRSGSRCSATRPLPATASTATATPPGAQLAISISEAARRPVHLTNVAVVGAESPDLGVQVDALAAPAGRAPARARDRHGRRQRRRRGHEARPTRRATCSRPSAACTASARRSSSAPAPTSAPSARWRSRCGRGRGACRAGWRRSRRWPSSPPAAARCPSATCSARCSPTTSSTSPPTASTRRRPATPRPPARCCRPAWTRWVCRPTPARRARSPPAGSRRPGAPRPRRWSGRAPRSSAAERFGRAEGRRGPFARLRRAALGDDAGRRHRERRAGARRRAGLMAASRSQSRTVPEEQPCPKP